MSKLNLDRDKIQACRDLAKKITQRVARDVDGYTTDSIERASLRFLGLEEAYEGKPVVGALLEAIPAAERGKGALYWLGRALVGQRTTPISLALQVASGKAQLTEGPDVSREEIARSLEPLVQKGWERLARSKGSGKDLSLRNSGRSRPTLFIRFGTGDIDQDIAQGRAALQSGADGLILIRSSGQSLMEYVPSGETHQGVEGTYLSQANLRKLREALNNGNGSSLARPRFAYASSGLCMPELTLIGLFEQADVLLNDAFYSVLFRGINVQRAFIDQFFSRLMVAPTSTLVHTAEHNFLSHAESYRVFPQVLATSFLNEQFFFLSHIGEAQMGFTHGYEIDPAMEDGLLYELAQAQVMRECFPKATIKYQPPTRHKTGDIFHSHLMDGFFTTVGVVTQQDILELGLASEATHHPLLMDRHRAIKTAHYVLKNARSVGDEIQWLANGKVVRRARGILDGAYRLLQKIDKAGGLFRAISSGYLCNVSRHLEEGAGQQGIIKKQADYFNPVWELLQRSAAASRETFYSTPRPRPERGSRSREDSSRGERPSRPARGSRRGNRSRSSRPRDRRPPRRSARNAAERAATNTAAPETAPTTPTEEAPPPVVVQEGEKT